MPEAELAEQFIQEATAAMAQRLAADRKRCYTDEEHAFHDFEEFVLRVSAYWCFGEGAHWHTGDGPYEAYVGELASPDSPLVSEVWRRYKVPRPPWWGDAV